MYDTFSGEWFVNRSKGWPNSLFDVSIWADFSQTGESPQFIGDFNGDGRDDIVSYHEVSGVNKSTGTKFGRRWATFRTRTGWSPQFVGDFNGDGMDDVVSYHEASGSWWVNKSTGSSFQRGAGQHSGHERVGHRNSLATLTETVWTTLSPTMKRQEPGG